MGKGLLFDKPIGLRAGERAERLSEPLKVVFRHHLANE